MDELIKEPDLPQVFYKVELKALFSPDPLTFTRLMCPRASSQLIQYIHHKIVVLTISVHFFPHVTRREIWPSYLWESLYMVLLDLVLLVIPLFLMAFSYGHVAKELWSGMTISNNDPGSPLSGTTEHFDLCWSSNVNGFIA